MGRLAVVFNETLGRLEASFEQMRRFTADVSHQLRTPLTALRSVGEVGLREHRDDASVQDDHRQHARGSGSARQPGRSPSDAVARGNAAGQAVARRVRRARAGRRSGSHLEVLAEEQGQSIDVEQVGAPQRVRRPVRRAAGAHQSGRQRDQVQPAGGRIRIRVAEASNEPIVDVIDSGRGIDAVGCASASSIASIARRMRRQQAPGSACRLPRGRWRRRAAGLTLAASGADGSTFRIALPRAARHAARALADQSRKARLQVTKQSSRLSSRAVVVRLQPDTTPQTCTRNVPYVASRH